MKTIHVSLYAVGIFACGAALLSCSGGAEGRMIGVGQKIHHDDFEYSVSSYRVSKTIGEGKAMVTAAGNFYIVAFMVENNAKRVNHEWDDSIAYIADEEGHVYENLPWAQKAIDRSSHFGPTQKHVTQAGSSESAILVFDLPAESRHPTLMVRGESLMGDMFDGGQFRKVKIRLW